MVGGDRLRAACVLCGGTQLKMRRMVEVRGVSELLDTQAAAGVVDEVHAWTRNVIDAMAGCGQDVAVVCNECQAWQQRREHRLPAQLLPLQVVLWFLRTHKRHADLDARLVQRVSRMLLQTGNYFGQMLSTAERALCAELVRAPVQCVLQMVARHVHERSGRCIFLTEARTAEELREVARHGLRARRRRTRASGPALPVAGGGGDELLKDELLKDELFDDELEPRARPQKKRAGAPRSSHDGRTGGDERAGQPAAGAAAHAAAGERARPRRVDGHGEAARARHDEHEQLPARGEPAACHGADRGLHPAAWRGAAVRPVG